MALVLPPRYQRRPNGGHRLLSGPIQFHPQRGQNPYQGFMGPGRGDVDYIHPMNGGPPLPGMGGHPPQLGGGGPWGGPGIGAMGRGVNGPNHRQHPDQEGPIHAMGGQPPQFQPPMGAGGGGGQLPFHPPMGGGMGPQYTGMGAHGYGQGNHGMGHSPYERLLQMLQQFQGGGRGGRQLPQPFRGMPGRGRTPGPLPPRNPLGY